MADREETVVATTRAELETTLRALGHDLRATPIRRVPGGGWYARVTARPAVQLTPPRPGRDRVPPALWIAMGIGAAAAVILAVLAIAWAVDHWAWVLLGVLVVGWVMRQVRRQR